MICWQGARCSARPCLSLPHGHCRDARLVGHHSPPLAATRPHACTYLRSAWKATVARFAPKHGTRAAARSNCGFRKTTCPPLGRRYWPAEGRAAKRVRKDAAPPRPGPTSRLFSTGVCSVLGAREFLSEVREPGRGLTHGLTASLRHGKTLLLMKCWAWCTSRSSEAAAPARATCKIDADTVASVPSPMAPAQRGAIARLTNSWGPSARSAHYSHPTLQLHLHLQEYRRVLFMWRPCGVSCSFGPFDLGQAYGISSL